MMVLLSIGPCDEHSSEGVGYFADSEMVWIDGMNA